jgi:hypothetical protein
MNWFEGDLKKNQNEKERVFTNAYTKSDLVQRRSRKTKRAKGVRPAQSTIL